MEITVGKTELIKALGFVGGVTSQKVGVIPILSNLLIETNGKEEIKVIGTDLEVGVSTKVSAEVREEGSITIPSKKLYEIIRELPDCKIEITVAKNNAVNIHGGKAFFKIMGIGKEDYPKLPDWDNKDALTLEQALLKECISLTAFAISHDETRYVLNGVLFSLQGDKLRLVATDGRRLAYIEKKIENKKDKEFNIIVPIKAVLELSKMLEWEGTIQIVPTQNQVIFDLGKTFLSSKLIEGKFPDYEQVIPKESTITTEANREEFLQAIRRTALLTSPEAPAVKMDFVKGKILVSSKSQNLGEAREEMAAETKGGEVAIGFNPYYFMDVLKNLDTENISFFLTTPDKPGLLKGKEGYKYVIMPMQLN
ncbi:MAG: DNA polymerase III subunit beta [Candidatus Omnitrophica bacterium]|nr:DNA polymerase III subunit beta [Candidatus Omnitrophota bacterium]